MKAAGALPKVPFLRYKTFQATISAIEKLSRLTFIRTKGSSRMGLSAFDPPIKRKARVGFGDRSLRGAAIDEPMVPLTRLNQVVLHT